MADKERKERFRGGATLDEKTVNAAFRTELYTYGKPGIIIRSAIGAVILLAVLLVHMPLWASLIAMVLGCWLFVSYDFPARVKARSYLKNHTGRKESKAYRFTDGTIVLKDGERGYSSVKRLVYDDFYLYIFFGRKDYLVIDISTIVPHDTQRLKSFIKERTGKEWETVSPSLLSHKERSEMRKRNRSL